MYNSSSKSKYSKEYGLRVQVYNIYCSTSVKYSSVGKNSGTRLMLVNEVALGNIFLTTRHDTHIKSPPEGFHSLHGVPSKKDLSDFQVKIIHTWWRVQRN